MMLESCAEALDAVDFGLFTLGQEGTILIWNDWMQDLTGVASGNAIGCRLDELFDEFKDSHILEAIERCLQDPTAPPAIFTGLMFPAHHHSQTTKHAPGLRVCVRPFQSRQQGNCCMLEVFDGGHHFTDVSLLQEKERLEVTLASISDAVVITDVDERIEFLNSVAEQHTGWNSEDAQGRPMDEVIKLVSGAADTNAAILYGADEFGYVDAGLMLVGKDGVQTPIELSVAAIDDGAGGSTGSVVVFRDITHSRRMVAQLFWQSSHDVLTGLMNRTHFEHHLNSLLASEAGSEKEHAVLYLDIDQFKVINDTCGHLAGDQLLQEAVGVMENKVRRSDALARLGGDEFGILLVDCPLDAALRITNELRQAVNDYRFSWEGKVFHISVSIGLVPVDKDAGPVTEIMSAADAACFTSKESGRNRVHVFKSGDSEAARMHGQMQWVAHIQSALDNDRLALFSQLIIPVDENSGLLPHREMLLRMFDDNGSIIPPGAFIPAAERYNLMSSLDRWVVKTAFTYLADLTAKGEEPFMMNINLSGGSLVEVGFLEFVLNQLKEKKLPPEYVCFEVTETAAIANMDEAKNFITQLRAEGCKFALDDFGSGLSSFGYLKRLPVDYLKIDGSFVCDILDDPIHEAMVEAINRVGHIMDIQTVAEFVENAEVLGRLKQLGVDYAQGYHIEKPGPLPPLD